MTDSYDTAYIKANFQDFCQSCLRNNKEKVNKFNSLFRNESFCSKFPTVFGFEVCQAGLQIRFKPPFYTILILQFSVTDTLPSNVCNKCYKALLDYLKFYDTVLTSRRQLEDIFSMADVKEELLEPTVGTVEILPSDDNLIPKVEDESVKEEPAPQDKPMKVRKKSKKRSPRKYKQCQECGKLVQNLRGETSQNFGGV
jgi:hypothetical protein